MEGQTDYTDSTIKIEFSATLIINPDYTNETAVVTIGAQYDNNNYIYVGSDKMAYSMVPVRVKTDRYMRTINESTSCSCTLLISFLSPPPVSSQVIHFHLIK